MLYGPMTHPQLLGALGRGFVVKGLSARLRELASLYGVAGLLPAAP